MSDVVQHVIIVDPNLDVNIRNKISRCLKGKSKRLGVAYEVHGDYARIKDHVTIVSNGATSVTSGDTNVSNDARVTRNTSVTSIETSVAGNPDTSVANDTIVKLNLKNRKLQGQIDIANKTLEDFRTDLQYFFSLFQRNARNLEMFDDDKSRLKEILGRLRK